MSALGKLSISYKKSEILGQKSLFTGINRLMFAHRATQGDSGFSLNSLNSPVEMASTGFTNPSATLLQSARLHYFKNNLTLTSSLRGSLISGLSYTVVNNNIVFLGFTAEEGEIFTGNFEFSKLGTIPFVDARPLVATGDLAANSTDFTVGEAFDLNKNPMSQVGAVLVYRNGLQQIRCIGNDLLSNGDYIEVGTGSTSSLIRFKQTHVTTDQISVVSVGSLAERPQESTIQFLETLSGKVDSMVPTLSAVSGQPESNFGGVSNVDLKTFGDTVIDHKKRISDLEAKLLVSRAIEQGDLNPVGMIVQSMLTESQFQSINSNSWVLMDGRNIAGSAYATITGAATIPDARGLVLRGKNNGRSDGQQNPSGDLALGTFQDQATAKNGLGISDPGHSHGTLGVNNMNGTSPGGGALTSQASSTSAAATGITLTAGDNETRMRNITVNHFIKIN